MSQFRSQWERLLGHCESPIESMFLSQFCASAVDYGYNIGRSTSDRETIAIHPQKRVVGYRIDFGIFFDFLQDYSGNLLIAVECDGHDWHDLTKEQAIRDRRRDRYFQSIGYKILRFTGSEIYANPTRCAMEVLQHVMDFQTACFVRAVDQAQVDAR